MIRNFKALGLALLAVFATAAISASAASAHKLIINGGANADLTGTQIGSPSIFGTKTSILEVSCEKATGAYTGINEQTEGTFLPTLSECFAEPFGEMSIDTNGCNLVISGTTFSHPKTDGGTETDAPVRIECPQGNKAQITAPGCTISFGESGNQNILGITYVNEGSGSTADVKANITLDSITFTTSGGFICALAGLPAEGKDGFLTGAATVKGYVHGSAHGTGHHVGIKFSE